MPDGPDSEKNGQGPDPIPGVPQQEYPVDRLRARVAGMLAGKPLAVYLVLIAGAATLVILLVVVWISATGGGGTERPICTTITTAAARDAILAGKVDQIDVLADASDPGSTLTGINLDFDDGSCRATAQGADFRNDLYLILGVASYYNQFAENRVQIKYKKQTVQPELLVTSTHAPTATPPVTETAAPSASPEKVVTPASTAEPTKPAETPAHAETATVAPGAKTPEPTVAPTRTTMATETPPAAHTVVPTGTARPPSAQDGGRTATAKPAA